MAHKGPALALEAPDQCGRSLRAPPNVRNQLRYGSLRRLLFHIAVRNKEHPGCAREQACGPIQEPDAAHVRQIRIAKYRLDPMGVSGFTARAEGCGARQARDNSGAQADAIVDAVSKRSYDENNRPFSPSRR